MLQGKVALVTGGHRVTGAHLMTRVNDGQMTYVQFMEDTFGTAATFRVGGVWKFRSDPAGGEVEV